MFVILMIEILDSEPDCLCGIVTDKYPNLVTREANVSTQYSIMSRVVDLWKEETNIQ